MKKLFTVLVVACALLSCDKDDDTTPVRQFEYGKNRFTLDIGGDMREFYVHVPAAYQSGQASPVVFMLHGTSGDGEKFYNISGWKEVGESENILTVFPSSWHHCVIDDGQVKHTTKWNIYPGSFSYCAGETPRDDIGFLRAIITDLEQRFDIDRQRMYIAGFSNGGQMAGRCAVEMSDVFAAVSENGGGLSSDTVFQPLRNLPVLFQFGNSDDRFTGGIDVDIPMEKFDSLLHTTPGFAKIVNVHVNSFQLESSYTLSGNENTALMATFRSADQAPEHVFHLVMVKDLDHQYPNGVNHWMNAAETQWEWMSQFRLE